MLQFRPHHFMCTLAFQGKGYSNFFIKNYQKIADQLNTDPNCLIQVIQKTDDVCKACPHQIKKSLCTKQSFVENLDKAHQKILGFQENQSISWKDAKETIKTRMTVQKFHVVCAGCEWKAYGICEEALKKEGIN